MFSAADETTGPLCYTEYTNKDTLGYDIKHIPDKTVDELAQICNETPDCKSFNARGWIKHTALPDDQLTSVPDGYGSYYVKQPDCDPNKKPMNWIMIAVIVFILLIVLGIAGYFMMSGDDDSEDHGTIVPNEGDSSQ